MSSPLRRGFAFVFALGLLPALAAAQAPGIVSFTGGSVFATFQADGDTVGWSFNVNRPVILTHLGFWDNPAVAGPMLLSHDVGIWNAAGTQLATTTVTPLSPLTGDFRYQQLVTPLQLQAATEYRLGAFYAAANTTADGYASGTTARTLAAGFTGISTLRDADGAQTGLVFPTVATAFTGRFGPNFLFTEVPEPASAALLALGGFALCRRRA